MSRTNGNHGYHHGGKGGGAHGGPLSSSLNFLRRLIETGSTLPDDLEVAVAFCRNVVNDPTAKLRDKNNAAKTLATIGKMTADVATSLNKDERIDGGQATESIVFQPIAVPIKERV